MILQFILSCIVCGIVFYFGFLYGKATEKNWSRQLAHDLIEIAEVGGMPESYQMTDQRMQRARETFTR